MADSVAGALIAATAAIIGLLVTNFLTAHREDRTRKLQLAIEHAEKHISEFYSPLMELVEELDAFATVSPNLENMPAASKIMYNDFFLPTHEKIVTILHDELHLVEGWNMPPSFTIFLQHYAGKKLEAALNKVGVSVAVRPVDYPGQFY